MPWSEIGAEAWALGALALATATAGGVGAVKWLKQRRAARDKRREQ